MQADKNFVLGKTRLSYIYTCSVGMASMNLHLGTAVQGRPRKNDNLPLVGVFCFDVTVRIDFYSGGALLALMKVEGDLIWFRAHGKTFRCNLWNVAVRVKEGYPHAFFMYEMDHEKSISDDDVMIILFSCNDVRNEALSVLRRTGALLLDEADQNLFGPRPGTARIDTHNPLGDCMRKNASLPDMHVIWEDMDYDMSD